jgi:hypothetical protein
MVAGASSGVALVFSQSLFSPEPVALLRRAESAALLDMSDGLELTARALEQDDDDLDERALSSLRDLRDRLAELARLGRASSRVARHSLVWHSQMTPAVREKESADHLDLLGGSCLMLTRACIATESAERRSLVPPVRELGDVLDSLAKELGNRQMRQRAADRALHVVRRSAGTVVPSKVTRATALATVRMVARHHGVRGSGSRTSRGRHTETERGTPCSPPAADAPDTVHPGPSPSRPMTVRS